MIDLDQTWDPFTIAETENKYRHLLTAARENEENNRGELVEILSMVARTQAWQGRFMESRLNLQEAEQLVEAMGADCPANAKIRMLMESARAYLLEKTPARARPLLSQAWTLAVSAGEDYFVIDIAQLMAKIESPKLQQDWLLKAIEIAEQSSQEKASWWLGALYSSLAWKYYELRQYSKALETMQTSRTHFLKRGTKRELFLADWSVGKILRTLNRLDEALELQKALLQKVKADGQGEGRVLEEIAECLLSLRHPLEAEEYFALAYHELSSDDRDKDEMPLRLKRLKDLGKVRNS